MKYIFFCTALLHGLLALSQKSDMPKYVLVIHGGAGTITKANMTNEKEAAYTAALSEALLAGYKKIKEGASSIDAVETAVKIMENNPLFNAGKGAVFTHDGKNELDAAIMNGHTKAAGSVAGVTTIKNPISAARAVMEKTSHVMLIGKGAESFAKQAGLEIVSQKYFYTKERWEGLLKAKEKEKQVYKSSFRSMNHDGKFGTVGCVALDNNGFLAAATSTGGMTNKRYGRVGDAPIIGAGTYANEYVAVSCTGWGEYFIRSVVAHDLSALIEYKNYTVSQAAEAVLDKVAKLGGDGGLIALDKDGHMSMSFNTEGMYRAAITTDGKMEIYIYK